MDNAVVYKNLNNTINEVHNDLSRVQYSLTRASGISLAGREISTINRFFGWASSVFAELKKFGLFGKATKDQKIALHTERAITVITLTAKRINSLIGLEAQAQHIQDLVTTYGLQIDNGNNNRAPADPVNTEVSSLVNQKPVESQPQQVESQPRQMEDGVNRSFPRPANLDTEMPLEREQSDHCGETVVAPPRQDASLKPMTSMASLTQSTSRQNKRSRSDRRGDTVERPSISRSNSQLVPSRRRDPMTITSASDLTRLLFDTTGSIKKVQISDPVGVLNLLHNELELLVTMEHEKRMEVDPDVVRLLESVGKLRNQNPNEQAVKTQLEKASETLKSVLVRLGHNNATVRAVAKQLTERSSKGLVPSGSRSMSGSDRKQKSKNHPIKLTTPAAVRTFANETLKQIESLSLSDRLDPVLGDLDLAGAISGFDAIPRPTRRDCETLMTKTLLTVWRADQGPSPQFMKPSRKTASVVEINDDVQKSKKNLPVQRLRVSSSRRERSKLLLPTFSAVAVKAPASAVAVKAPAADEHKDSEDANSKAWDTATTSDHGSKKQGVLRSIWSMLASGQG